MTPWWKRISPFEQRILRFGVGFTIGLAPFLGNADVPGFTAVIRMYPESLQNWLIPLSGLVMGTIGVVVEFASGRKPGQRKLTAWFTRTIVLFAVSLILLIALYQFLVVRVDKTVIREGGVQPVQVSVITGTLTVPPQWEGSPCACRPGQPARACLTDISLNPDHVATCFGAERIAFATIALSLIYLVVTGAFAAAVGLLMLAELSGGVPATIKA
jgi:hypothetical protein